MQQSDPHGTASHIPKGEHAPVGTVLMTSKILAVAECEGNHQAHHKYLAAHSTSFVVLTTQ
jgi:hypothetical protein